MHVEFTDVQKNNVEHNLQINKFYSFNEIIFSLGLWSAMILFVCSMLEVTLLYTLWLE